MASLCRFYFSKVISQIVSFSQQCQLKIQLFVSNKKIETIQMKSLETPLQLSDLDIWFSYTFLFLFLPFWFISLSQTSIPSRPHSNEVNISFILFVWCGEKKTIRTIIVTTTTTTTSGPTRWILWQCIKYKKSLGEIIVWSQIFVTVAMIFSLYSFNFFTFTFHLWFRT